VILKSEPTFLPGLQVLLARAAAPERALTNLKRLIQGATDPDALISELADDPRLLETLVTLLAGSQFFSEVLVRHPEYLPRLREIRRLAQAKDVAQFVAEAREACAGLSTVEERLDALRRFQRWELLRLGTCDLLGLLALPTITVQLSHLAESLVRVCLSLGVERFGDENKGFAVLALGKLGGEELNYSSDVDLVFLAAIPERARRLAEWLIGALSRPTAEGFLYRVDLRLRPWGEVGPLVVSVEGYLGYLQRHARLWEKQALLKARVIAGDDDLGQSFLRRAAPLLCASAEEARTAVHEMKRRIEEQLSRNGRAWGEVKLGVGSIRDVEFVTQYLQLVHGAAEAEVLSPNTLNALARLYGQGILAADDYRVLVEGYTFLRSLEHYLQFLDNRQTHLLPDDAADIAYLARRLGFAGTEAGTRLLERYQEHSAAIRAVYRHYLAPEEAAMPQAESLNHVTERHLARMVPSYSETFASQEIQQHAALAAGLSPERPVEVRADLLPDGAWRVTIVGYDYPGELSLICGLLFAYGLSIRDGHVFTYEPLAETTASMPEGAARRKIVDMFTVQPARATISPETWVHYAEDLAALLRLLERGEHDAAHGALARRVAETLRGWGIPHATLQPVEITIDNTASERYTALIIDAPDTIGFLYEFTSALALNGLYIAQVTVESVGQRVHDTLYLCDAQGRKITAPEKQRELRAATVLVKHFTHLLPQSPNPEAALLHFREFLGQLFLRPDWPDALTSLSRPEVLTALAQLLGVSDFLWEDFLRMQYANLFPVVSAVDELAQAKDKAQLRAELRAAMAVEDWRAALNALKDREMFRVDLRHILGHCATFGQFSAELSDLAEVVVEEACRGCLRELHRSFGTPLLQDGRECPWCVCALGKCGGRELGYASDIELLFLYAGSGETNGAQRISTAEFYEKLVQGVLGAIRARREGIFHLDLRLRPYGEAGSLAVSLESFRRYFAPGGPRWEYERMALVKLRPIAGDATLGQEILALRDAFVYNGDPPDLAAMRAMRERQLRHLVAGGTINAKFSPGGLVDVEYLVQALQIRHGPLRASLRTANTREALAALRAEEILEEEAYRRLDAAYVFIRQLIDALRMVRGNAQDLTVPPIERDEFAFLARRMGYGGDPSRLREDLVSHLRAVQELNAQLLGQG